MATARKRGGVAPKLLKKAVGKKARAKKAAPEAPGLAVGDVVVWNPSYSNDRMERRTVTAIKRTASPHYLRVSISGCSEKTVFSWNVSQRRGRNGSSFHVQIIEPLTPELDERIEAQELIARAATVFDPAERLREGNDFRDFRDFSHAGERARLKFTEENVRAKLSVATKLIAAAQKVLADIDAFRRNAKHLV